MIKNFIYLVLGTILLCSNSSLSQPINSKDIFTDPDYSLVKISPDGQYISSYFRASDADYIVAFSSDTGAEITRVKIGLNYELKYYDWITNNQLFVSFKYKWREPNYIYTLKNNKFHQDQLKVKGYLIDNLFKQADKVLFAKKNRRVYDLYFIKVEDLLASNFEQAEEIEINNKNVAHYYYDNDLEKILSIIVDKDGDENVSINYLDRRSGDWVNILNVSNQDYVLMPVSFFNENELGVLTNKDTDKIVLRKYYIDSQAIGEIIYQHPDYDLDSAHIVKGRLESVSYYEHGILQTRYFDGGNDALANLLIEEMSDLQFYIVDKSIDKNKYLLFATGSNKSGEYYIYDNNRNKIKHLFSQYGKLKNRSFAASELIKFTSKDGTKLEAFLTLPRDLDYKTLLVMPHGGPIGVKETDQFNREVQYYASRGFSILRVNFRGSAGFGKSFQKSGVGQFGKLIEQDISAAVNNVTEKYNFKHICSIGASYGGYSAVMLAIKHPDIYECVVGAYGIYDLPLLFNISNHLIKKEAVKSIENTVGKYNDNLKLVSPVNLYKKLKSPILLIAGLEDKRANFEHTNRFKYLLQKNGHDLETMFYQNVGHGQDSYSGERHELATIYDYLVRKLNLSIPDDTSSNKLVRQALANDFEVLGDGYAQDDNVSDNPYKSIQFYKKAAKYGSARAAFNVASRYYVGGVVKRDLSKAFSYYLMSAEYGSSAAHIQLAQMYSQGEFTTKNWSKALSHFKKALEISDTAVNSMKLAGFYCLADKPYKDIDLCLKGLDVSLYSNQASSKANKNVKRELSHLLSLMIAEGNLAPNELKKIQKHILDLYKLDAIETLLSKVQAGVFTRISKTKKRPRRKYKLISKGQDVFIDKNNSQYAGAYFATQATRSDVEADRVALSVVWKLILPDGNKRILSSEILYAAPGSKWQVFKPIITDYANSEVQLQIHSLDQKILLSKSFLVKMEN